MAIVERRQTRTGGTRWRVRFFDRGRRESETFDTETAAKSFALHAEAAGGWPQGWTPGVGWERDIEPARIVTLDDWAAQVIPGRARASARARADYAAQWQRHISPVLGTTPLAAVTPAAVRAWAVGLLGDVSAKTAWNIHALLSSVLTDAVEEGLIARNPARGAMPSPGSPGVEPVFLDGEELRALLRALPPHYRPLVRFLVATGLRFGEATALRRRDITAGVVTVGRAWKRTPGGFIIGEPKTRRSRRTVTVDRRTLRRLAPLLRGDRDGLVFATPGGGPVRHANFYNRIWAPAVATLPRRPRIHDLRHTHASWLLGAGVPMIAVQRRLGHESITTTVDRYGHLAPDAETQAVAATMLALRARATVPRTPGDSSTGGSPK